MADLETAADAAMVRIKEFTGEVEEARSAFDAIEQQLSQVASRLDADSTALDEGFNTLVEKVGAGRTQLAEQMQQSVQALADLQHEVADAGAHGEEELREAQQAMAALQDEVEAAEPQVAALVQRIENVAQQLTSRAAEIETELEETLGEAREFVGVQLVNGLKDLHEQIQEGAEALHGTLTGKCLETLDAAKTHWQTQLEEVEQSVQKAFEDAAEHAAKTVEEALKDCVEGHEEALDGVAQSVTTLEAALQKLRSAVDSQKGEVDQARDGLSEGLGETGGRIERAQSALQSVKELLASFTFVEM